MLRIYNSLTKQKEDFRPRQGRKVGLYTCGPTVYDFAHIGNLRTYLFEDVLKRTLGLHGYTVRHVMNITDVGHLTDDADEGEDKMERAASRHRKTAKQLASFYTKAFLRDLKRLHIRMPDALPRATEYIAEQIALVERLEALGVTYTIEDGVYFDTIQFPEYGKAFGGQRLEEKEAGARVAVRSGKRHPHDFALWKLTPPGVQRQQEWDAPWGRGFPGWHLECSAMSRALLGQPFDIHCGGIDHIPVHHTNEIAQSEAAYGVSLAHVWCHGAFLTVDSGRMGKSEGNLITMDQMIARGVDPLAYRYLCLGAHYRSPLNFTWQSLEGAQAALQHLRAWCRELPKPPARVNAARRGAVRAFTEQFRDTVGNDLDTPRALAQLWEITKSKIDAREQSVGVAYADQVFGLGLVDLLGKPLRVPREARALAADREEARRAKDWPRADRLRAQIEALGWSVEDTSDGPKLKKS